MKLHLVRQKIFKKKIHVKCEVRQILNTSSRENSFQAFASKVEVNFMKSIGNSPYLTHLLKAAEPSTHSPKKKPIFWPQNLPLIRISSNLPVYRPIW